VAVTGLGCLSAAGATAEGFWRALGEGRDLARAEEIDLGGGRSATVRLARLGAVDWDAFLAAARRRRMSFISQAWVVACLQARADAGLPSSADPERSAVVLGTGFGGVQDTVEYLEGIRRDGLGLGSPFLFTESVANAPAGHAAIELGCRGLNLTLTCGDLSGAQAVEVGARAILDGRADRVYAGGVEQMAGATLAILARLGALPAPRADRKRRWRSPGPPRPGRFAGDGAACLLLEAAEAAEQRRALPYAEVCGGWLASDPSAARTSWSASAERRAEALSRALRAAGMSPRDIDAVVLHACGELRADAAEDEAVRRLLFSERPAARIDTLRPSHVFGAFAAAGAFSAVAAALWLREGPATGRRAALVSAAGWGGGCLGLVLRHAR
jgi:3-oxoacyl-[acyl-carrier-protein] synthase II